MPERTGQGTVGGSGVSHEGIAVIGMACRLPGAAGPEEFWRLLRTGTDAVTDVPDGRWDIPSAEPAGRTTGPGPVRRGGFLDAVDLFDADFFGISPREVEVMDPQQRLMLELSWEALEHAGVVPAALRGSDTAVFAGAMADDYALLLHRYGTAATTRHTLTGLHRSIIANRVSYTLGLRGPSIVVDTGQSSSLVAVHMACDSLRGGESSLALAAGVNLNLAGETTRAVSAFGALSPDGTCRTFDADANGYVRGEGGAVVVLKRLADALTDGDRVHAVLLGSAVNNDGAGESLTRPSADAQREVVSRAHARAGVRGADVAYVELHGTGTKVGDPVEAAALGEVFGPDRPAHAPLAVGSAKTNVGHLEGAAGIVGLLKVILSIDHGEIPPSLHYRSPHPKIALSDLGLRVQDRLTDWPPGRRGRIAGVSSFGMGGTNCHVVVGDTAAVVPDGATDGPLPERTAPVLLPVSARTPAALAKQAARLHAHLTEHPDLHLTAVERTLTLGRTHFTERAAVIGRDRTEVLAGLEALAEGRGHRAVVRGQAGERPKVAFVYSGQGSQYPGMGHDLYQTYPAFAAAFDEACTALDQHLEHSLREVMWGAHTDLLDRTDYTRPALFAFQTALTHLLATLGITPTLVAGHSVGEIAAAHTAGILTLPHAARLLTTRGHLMHTTPPGTMAALNHHQAGIPFVSSVTGTPTHPDPTYWPRQLRQPVRHDHTTDTITQHTTLSLEIGPDTTLAAHTAPTQHRTHPQTTALLTALATLHTHGHPINWPHQPTQPPTPLPTYPFQRRRHWFVARAVGHPAPPVPSAERAADRNDTPDVR
ncbi:type I polyketide synthase [Streptomyces sp. NPDC001848]|uniref:type I polyketide synthase n=1 Tax=Streptomyces sp. NPDC001848 TaxID=3364618 RepID=UPI0036916082